MSHHIEGDRRRKNQHIILAGLDLDAIGVGYPEPLLGHLGDFMSAILYGVFVVENIALHIQIRTIAHLDRPALAYGGDESLLHHGQILTVWPLDLHRILYPQHSLLDLAELMSLWILEDQCVA